MKLKELINTNLDIEISNINSNSRKIKEGGLFVAVTGFITDGHKYIDNAVENGAVCIICEREPDCDVPYIIVENSRKVLAEVSHRFYGEPTKKLKLIGVTGTNGKTTVTYLIKAILEANGEKVGLIGTNQNMIGEKVMEAERTTPESTELAEMFSQMVSEGCTCAVMEVSSHSLDLFRVHCCEFDVGVFTNLTQDHLDFHGTMENYLNAKSKLFTMCKKAVVNTDDAYGTVIAEKTLCDIITYGKESGTLKAENIEYQSCGVSFDCMGKNYRLRIPGGFSVYNAMAAIGTAKMLGIDDEIIYKALSEANGVKGRIEVYPTNKDFTVLIDYAHTPDGIKNILESVRGFAKGRIVILFGCGGDRDATKRPKMGKIAGALADICIITSDNPRSEEPASIIRDILSGMNDATADYIVIENRRDAIAYAIKNARKDDVIVLAGKGHETYQILNDGTIHFDEREVLDEIFATLE